MGKETLPFSQRLFRALVRVLPFDFRTNYEGEMEGVFREQHREVEQRGGLLGALKLWKETIVGIFTTAPREHWQILTSDCSYALRMMGKNLGFTVVAVLTLALGIGANTAIFSVVHSVLLSPLPYANAHRLMLVKEILPNISAEPFNVSGPDIAQIQKLNHVFEDVGGFEV